MATGREAGHCTAGYSPQRSYAKIPGFDPGYRLMMRTLPLGHGVPADREGIVFVRTEPEGGTMMVGFDEVVERITDAARQIEARRGRVACSGGRRLGVPGEACEGGETSDRRRTRSRLRDGAGAGDSAKVAAEADAEMSSDARESVLAAHLAICKLKAGA